MGGGTLLDENYDDDDNDDRATFYLKLPKPERFCNNM
jgi:hypothetical protein